MKVLIGFIMDGHGGGVDNYLLNFLENVNDGDIQIDFLTNEIDAGLKQYLKERGSDLFAIANLKHPMRQYRQVRALIRRGQYDIVYLNISTAIDCVAAWAAQSMKVKRIMLHSHSSGNDCSHVLKRVVFHVIHSICRLTFYKAGTEYYGCSKKAGFWMFPKKIVASPQFHVIFNSVDMERFYYDPKIRDEVRKELKVEDKFVIGHVGNFLYCKNHFFLLDIFAALHKECPDAVLILAGTGAGLEPVREAVMKKGLEDSVQMLGFRQDIDRLYQAMDFFVLPSLFEGLPTVGVEAQSTGLPCLMSDAITDEAKITDKCWFLPLHTAPDKWSRFILEKRDNNREEIKWTGSRDDYSIETLKVRERKLIWEDREVGDGIS